MNKNSSDKSGGIGFAGLLQIAFIVLKLAELISWSWLWVLSPMWIGLLLLVLFTTLVWLITNRR